MCSMRTDADFASEISRRRDVFLYFQSDFSPDVSRPAEKYLGGVEYRSKITGKNSSEFAFNNRKMENHLGIIGIL